MADAFTTLIPVQPALGVRATTKLRGPQPLYEVERSTQIVPGANRPGIISGAGSRPMTPKDLQAALASPGHVALTWDLPHALGATSFVLYVARNLPVFLRNQWTRIVLGYVGSHDLYDLATGTYYFAVAGMNAQGESPISLIVSADVPPVPLPAPQTIVPTAGQGQIGIWLTPVAGATGYVLYTSNVGGGTLNGGVRTVLTGNFTALAAMGNATLYIRAATLNGVTEGLPTTPELGVWVHGVLTIDAVVGAVPPRGAVAMHATGGTDAGYVWALSVNSSGGSIDASTGAYTAGATPSVTDTVRVTDSRGNTTTTPVNVGPQIAIVGAATSPPRGSIAFTATGGAGSGYVWDFLTNNSGGSIGAGTGAYTAGATPSVTDTVRVTDPLGNVATKAITVTAGVSIAAGPPTRQPGETYTYVATGGSGAGYSWVLAVNNSGGSIDAGSGLYTAGAVNGATDTIQVTDSLGNTATTTVIISANALLDANTVLLYDFEGDFTDSAGHLDLPFTGDGSRFDRLYGVGQASGKKGVSLDTGIFGNAPLTAAQQAVISNAMAGENTVEFWVSYSGAPGGTYPMFVCNQSRGWTNGSERLFAVHLDPTNGLNYATTNGGTLRTYTRTGFPIGKLTHVAIRNRAIGGGNYATELFLNGASVAWTTPGNSASHGPPNPVDGGAWMLSIAGDYNASPGTLGTFTGFMDSFRLSNKARSDAEILASYNLRSVAAAPTDGNTVSYWPFTGDGTDSLGVNNLAAAGGAVNAGGGHIVAGAGGDVVAGGAAYLTKTSDAALRNVMKGAWTLEGWFYANSSQVGFSWPSVCAFEQVGGGNRQMLIFFYPTNWSVYLDYQTGSLSSAANSVKSNAWNHIAARRRLVSPGVYTYDLFLNGVLSATGGAGPSGNPDDASLVLNFMRGNGYSFYGGLATWRLSSVARTDQEVADYFRATSATPFFSPATWQRPTLVAFGGDPVPYYLVTESSTPPLASDPGWSATKPTSFTPAALGATTLYGWVKVYGAVYAAGAASVTTIPTLIPYAASEVGHAVVNGGALVDVGRVQNRWSKFGNPVFNAASSVWGRLAESVGATPTANDYFAFVSPNVLAFSGDFTITFIAAAKPSVEEVVFWNGGWATNGYYFSYAPTNGYWLIVNTTNVHKSNIADADATSPHVVSFGRAGSTMLWKVDGNATGSDPLGTYSPLTTYVPALLKQFSGKLWEIRFTTATPTGAALDALHTAIMTPP